MNKLDISKEREAFEAWAETREFYLGKSNLGFYESQLTEDAWLAWQARAQLDSGEWVSVKQALPEHDVTVLCYNPELGVRLGRRLSGGQPYIRPQGCMGFDETTVHWMPLPGEPE